MEFKKILVTTDFSDYSHYAIPYAVELAIKYSAEMTLFHVIEPVIAPADFAWGSYNISEIEHKTQEFAKTNLDKILKEKVPESVKCNTVIGYGNPFKEVIELAKTANYDLVIVSTHGLTGLSHILFGSTAEKIVRKSSVPVLTVRDPAHKFEMP